MESSARLSSMSSEIMKMQSLKRMYISLLLLVVGFPIFGVVSFLLLGEQIGFVLTCVYVLAFLIFGIIVTNSKCPECGKSFFRRIIFYSSGWKCVHCGASVFKSKGS